MLFILYYVFYILCTVGQQMDISILLNLVRHLFIIDLINVRAHCA